ncbi:NRDE family protein [Microbacterium sp. JZ37]|uniref:NRDE family protein n=1 Tax=Microbacterium sp. JZ37 TaxID=2654193 RepID=UPI002B48E636|nr:NRDE family protein [Microbacterium sp. JZ37]WRH16490.1 hypothetical protein GC092_02470 [Microbacterium sp. JZ37]
MCTVVIRIPEPGATAEPVRLLAVRDEDPARPWNPLGSWWPQLPDVVGVQDRLAGGAWLAARPGRLAVLLNRAGEPDLPAAQIASRGGIVLDAVGGATPQGELRTLGFNLVEVDGDGASVVSWDGQELRRERLSPGTHMIAHTDADDPATPRIAAWHAAFEAASTDGDASGWWEPWLTVLAQSAELSPEDDRAIIRDNRPHGYPTQSLLACVASVSAQTTDVRYAELPHAGEWSPLSFEPPRG